MADVRWGYYLRSWGLLLLPVFAWNVALTSYLPAPWGTSEFQREIPWLLTTAEQTTRVAVMGLPFLMPMELATRMQRAALWVFGLGTVIYGASWVALIVAPASAWATSPSGALAPAYTPSIWLGALAVLGRRLYWGWFYRWWMYLLAAGAFLAAHVGHAALVFGRTY